MIAFRRIVQIFLILVASSSSFSPAANPVLSRARHGAPRPTRLFDATSTDPSEMKLRDIQTELKEMGVSYADCFDRDSLTRRLKEARNGEIPINTAQQQTKGHQEAPTQEQEATASSNTDTQSTSHSTSTPSPSSSSSSSFDKEATLAELRSLRVKELRTELAERNIRWGNMVEKEDLVQALLKAREAASHFSSSGILSPGQVADIDADTLQKELSTPAGTPLLLDVYATWCGPCQMMAPQLQMAAQELGDSVRVAKMDSDKYPEWASRLQVGGLPTVILFDSSGNEVERVEGALMKNGLVEFARNGV